jgi:hypothetical protein
VVRPPSVFAHPPRLNRSGKEQRIVIIIMDRKHNNDCLLRAHAAVSVADAAAILGRSTSWVHNRLTENSLDVVRLPDSKRIAITIASVVRLSEEMAARRTVRHRKAERPWLRLVVDNDPK